VQRYPIDEEVRLSTHVQRRDFFRLAAAGITVAGAGSLLAAPRAQALPPKPVQDDFGYVQFGVVAELVCEVYYRRAIAEGDWTHGERRRLAIARDGDTRHLRKLNGLLGPDDGVTRTDFEIRFPANAFSSRERILAQGERLEKLVVGTYIDGVASTVDPGTRSLLARLLAADARHLAGLAELNGGTAVSSGLQAAHFLEPAGGELDTYLRLESFVNQGGS
jgi:hypothetical protein